MLTGDEVVWTSQPLPDLEEQGKKAQDTAGNFSWNVWTA